MWFQPAWHPIRHLRRRLLPSGTQPGRRYDALGADVRDAERLTRDIDAAMSDMRFVIRPHAGPNILLPAKLDLLGIDPGYLEVADSEAFKALGAACDRCPNWRRCARDLAPRRCDDGIERLLLECRSDRRTRHRKAGRRDNWAYLETTAVPFNTHRHKPAHTSRISAMRHRQTFSNDTRKKDLVMAMKRIHLELARSHEFPGGSRERGYDFVAPLDDAGHLLADEWRQERKHCHVRRFWHGQADEHGLLVHKRGGTWAFDYNPSTDADDEPGFKFDRHHFVPGEYVSITEHDDIQRTFRVVSVLHLR